MGDGLESRCVVRVYGADGGVRLVRHHLHFFLKRNWLEKLHTQEILLVGITA